VAEPAQQTEVQQSEIEAKAAPAHAASNPNLRPIDPRPIRHVHHGQTGAMWTASLVSLGAFLIGGISIMLGPNWVLFSIAVVICILGIVAGVVMQKLGYGIYEKQ
jgi:cytosine/uracil/thiamine/allantoin permease